MLFFCNKFNFTYLRICFVFIIYISGLSGFSIIRFAFAFVPISPDKRGSTVFEFAYLSIFYVLRLAVMQPVAQPPYCGDSSGVPC